MKKYCYCMLKFRPLLTLVVRVVYSFFEVILQSKKYFIANRNNRLSISS